MAARLLMPARQVEFVFIMNILETWQKLASVPGGSFIFSRVLRHWVPYTGTVRPEVVELRPGFARVQMRDRRIVRNHLSSIHAAALMNFAEATTGLAFTSGLPAGGRAILTRFEIDYLKKARGTLTSQCEAPVPSSLESKDFEVECVVKDESGEVVCRAKARWRAGAASRK